MFLFYCGLLFVFKNVIPCEYEIVMQLMHLIFIFSSNTSVGPHALMGMFVELLEFDGAVLNGLTNITNELKRALHWATVMLSEGARFQSVRRHTCQALNTGQNITLETVLWLRMRNWERMSEYWVMCQRHDDNADLPMDLDLVEKMAALDIHSFADIRQELCMLLFNPKALE